MMALYRAQLLVAENEPKAPPVRSENQEEIPFDLRAQINKRRKVMLNMKGVFVPALLAITGLLGMPQANADEDKDCSRFTA